ncbi:hypothetical protein K443DRAFT_523804 [Laccaria amethystina LaAM-08-1]|uniref:Uncharacterized protein n=1 Tax=Laccaria amethystina LaAM-08-1 TaxID=1095629 RepID=A0A0C9WTG3_9AGAR|nr:hypothetical protein K443DRAFT_523804 [Laccaria amethystina LaAM-08-1]
MMCRIRSEKLSEFYRPRRFQPSADPQTTSNPIFDPSHHTSLFITRSSQTLVFVSFAITIYHRTQKELHQDTDAGKPTSRCFRSGRIILLVTIMINPSKTLRPGRKNTDHFRKFKDILVGKQRG